jgi:hypothetical protein
MAEAEFRFTVPTICAELPEPGEPDEGRIPLLRLHEDDWRQVEFVHRSTAEVARPEMAEIVAIRAESAGTTGYERVRARQEPKAPLAAAGVAASDLERRLEIGEQFGGVSYDPSVAPLFGRGGQTLGAIPGSFAFQTSGGVTIYGLARGGLLEVLGVQDRPRSFPLPEADAIAQFNLDHGLIVVNWV